MTTELEDGDELLQTSLSGPLPSQIADLRSLQNDFEFAKNCASAYLNLDKVTMDDASRKVVSEALWTAAAISYRRGFTTGKAHLVPQGPRLKIPKSWFEQLNPEFKEAHEAILAVANQHIAHQTGKDEHIVMTALLMPPPNPPAVAGVGAMVVRVIQGEVQVRQLGGLCESLLKGIQREVERLTAELLEEVNGMDLEELYGPPGSPPDA